MHLKLTALATSLLLAAPALAYEPPVRSGVTYVVEADERDGTGAGILTIRPANEQGAPEEDAAPTKVRVSGCDGEIGNLARIENGAVSGTLRTFGENRSAGGATAPRALMGSAGAPGDPRGSCRIG